MKIFFLLLFFIGWEAQAFEGGSIEGLSLLWAQEYIGADLVREEFSEPFPTELPCLVFDLFYSSYNQDNHGFVVSDLISHERNHAILPFSLSCEPKEYFDFNLGGSSFATGATSDISDLLRDFSQGIINTSVLVGDEPGRLTYFNQRIVRVMEENLRIIFVMGSGNDYDPLQVEYSRSLLSYLKEEKKAIIVGSGSTFGGVSQFSQEQVSILAPSDYYLTSTLRGERNSFGGTSGATPLVSGTLIGFILLSGYYLNVEEAITLLQKTAIPVLPSLSPFKENGSGLLNSYKIIRIAKRLKEECSSDKDCFSEKIMNDEIYHFECEPEDNSRENAFLCEREDWRWEELSNFFEEQGFSINALHYKAVALAVKFQKGEVSSEDIFNLLLELRSNLESNNFLTSRNSLSLLRGFIAYSFLYLERSGWSEMSTQYLRERFIELRLEEDNLDSYLYTIGRNYTYLSGGSLGEFLVNFLSEDTESRSHIVRQDIENNLEEILLGISRSGFEEIVEKSSDPVLLSLAVSIITDSNENISVEDGMSSFEKIIEKSTDPGVLREISLALFFGGRFLLESAMPLLEKIVEKSSDSIVLTQVIYNLKLNRKLPLERVVSLFEKIIEKSTDLGVLREISRALAFGERFRLESAMPLLEKIVEKSSDSIVLNQVIYNLKLNRKLPLERVVSLLKKIVKKSSSQLVLWAVTSIFFEFGSLLSSEIVISFLEEIIEKTSASGVLKEVVRVLGYDKRFPLKDTKSLLEKIVEKSSDPSVLREIVAVIISNENLSPGYVVLIFKEKVEKSSDPEVLREW